MFSTGSGASGSEAIRGNRSKQVSHLNSIRTQVGQSRVLSIENRTVYRAQRPFLSSPTLPHCPLRACFATAHKGRGCGDSGLPSPAPGSGGPQSRARRCLSFRARPKRKIGGRIAQITFRNQLGLNRIRRDKCPGRIRTRFRIRPGSSLFLLTSYQNSSLPRSFSSRTGPKRRESSAPSRASPRTKSSPSCSSSGYAGPPGRASVRVKL